MGATIVLSHANSFGLYTYRRIIEGLEQAQNRVVGVEQFGHHASYPVTNNWPHLVEQLQASVTQALSASSQSLTGDTAYQSSDAKPPELYLLGHSLGGYLSLMCAARFPIIAGAKVQGVILLDAPLLGGWKAKMLALSKKLGCIERLSPARISRHRRNHWDSLDEVHQHFAAKPTFQRWHPDVLRDYVHHGFESCTSLQDSRADTPDASGAGFTLRFKREVESEIYNTLPDNLPSLLAKHPVPCPVAFVQGSHSKEVRQVGLGYTHKVVQSSQQGRLYQVEGSHLFPMEKPDETLAVILDCLAYWRMRSKESV